MESLGIVLIFLILLVKSPQFFIYDQLLCITGFDWFSQNSETFSVEWSNHTETGICSIYREKTSSSQQRVNIVENDDFGNVNFSDIYQDLRDEESNSSRIVSTPKMCVKTSSSCNKSNQNKSINASAVLDSQDQDILKILERMQSTGEVGTTLYKNITSNCVYEPRIEGYSCSDPVFNLSRRILTETEIKFLEKGLNFEPILKKITELGLRTDFNKFCRRMRTKWYFKKEPTKKFCNI